MSNRSVPGARSAYYGNKDEAYSYATCIRATNEDGQSIYNVTRYSNTTSRHQSYDRVRSGDFTWEKSIMVDNVPKGASASDLQRLAKEKYSA